MMRGMALDWVCQVDTRKIDVRHPRYKGSALRKDGFGALGTQVFEKNV